MDEVFDIVDLVLYFLALLSVIVWAVTIAKAFMFFRMGKQNKKFMRAFAEIKHLRGLTTVAKFTQGSLARICQSGINEILSIQDNHVAWKSQREMLVHALRSQAHIEQHRMEKGLAILASIGSTAPFIGLFGTVWGIMHAFTGFAGMEQVTLATVAPGIAEALVATAIGLFSAIPAVIAYNRFARDIDRVATHQETFIEEFSNILQRNLGAQPASTGHTASGH